MTHIHTKERKVGFVFQHYALFRHMTVFENIAYGLKVRPRKTRPSKQEIAEKVGNIEASQVRGFCESVSIPFIRWSTAARGISASISR